MAKKTKVKGESKVSEKGETLESEKELYIPIPGKSGIIDFFYLFTGLGILLAIFMVGDILLHYVFHIL